jgi:hypothetical protein
LIELSVEVQAGLTLEFVCDSRHALVVDMRTGVDWILVRAVQFAIAVESWFFGSAHSRSGPLGTRWYGFAGTGENVHPRIAQVAIGVVIQIGGALLLEALHISADVIELRALVLRVDVVAVFAVQAVEVNSWEDRRWARCCLRQGSWMKAAAIEDVDPKIASLPSGVVEEIRRANAMKTDVVGAEVEVVTACQLRVSIDAVRDVIAVHRRGSCDGDVGRFGCRGEFRRPFRSGAHEGVRRNVALFGLLVEYQTVRAVQLASLAAIATVESIGAVDNVVPIPSTRTIEIDMWQSYWMKSGGFGFVDVFASARKNLVLMSAFVSFLVVNEIGRALGLDCHATNADVE